jgi:hypothetical protein
MKNTAWIFTATLALACACVGQTTQERTQIRPEASVSISGSGGLGYQNPIMGGAVGFEASGRYWLDLTSFNFDSARKIETGNGIEFSSSTLGMLRYKGLLAGGGVRWAQERTSRWTKASFRPQVAGGFEWAPVRVIGRYILPGSDRLNGVRGFGADITYSLSRHFRLQSTLESLSFYPTGFPDQPRLRGTFMSFGVSVIK